MFERFVTDGSIIGVMTDGGTAYLNLGEEYDVNHNVVYHNRCFVNAESVSTWVDRLGVEV